MFTKNHCIWWFYRVEKYVTKVDKVIKITADFQHQSYIRSVGLMFYYFLVSDGHFLTLPWNKASYRLVPIPLASLVVSWGAIGAPWDAEEMHWHVHLNQWKGLALEVSEKVGYISNIKYLCNCWYSSVSALLWYRPTVTILQIKNTRFKIPESMGAFPEILQDCERDAISRFSWGVIPKVLPLTSSLLENHGKYYPLDYLQRSQSQKQYHPIPSPS